MLYVITGVRGAGKTTLIESLKTFAIGIVLQPSTTRAPRYEGETEYDFVERWKPTSYAWEIKVGNNIYGMRKSEIERAACDVAFTVFDPLSIDIFYEYRRRTRIDALVIGLDTIEYFTEQHARVGMSQSRMMTFGDFSRAKDQVNQADLIIRGSSAELMRRMQELISPSRCKPTLGSI